MHDAAEAATRENKMEIVIVKSNVTGEYGWCPRDAYESLKLLMHYEDKRSYLTTADEAIAECRRDKNIPKNAKFTVIPDMEVTGDWRNPADWKLISE